MENLRVIFSKSKELIKLNHIDVIKIFEEAFLKADIKIKYTEKKKLNSLITFADPLSKGIESVAELMDVVLVEKVDITYFVREINKVLPSGITVLNAEYVEDDGISIMDKVYASTYIISLIYDEKKFLDKTPRQIEEIKKYYQNKLNEYLEQDRLLVLKKSKSRMERIDIKQDIINFDFLIDGTLEITVCSGLRKRLEPSNIMVGFNEYISENIKYNLKRTKILYR